MLVKGISQMHKVARRWPQAATVVVRAGCKGRDHIAGLTHGLQERARFLVPVRDRGVQSGGVGVELIRLQRTCGDGKTDGAGGRAEA